MTGRPHARASAWFGLVMVMLLACGSAVQAHDPIARLRNGDFEGFLDDALRTGWVMAGLNGVGAAALAAAIARVLARSNISVEDQLDAVRSELDRCRAKARELRSRYESGREAITKSEEMLASADRWAGVYWAAAVTNDITAVLGAVLLVVEFGVALGIVGVAEATGAAATTTVAAAGGAASSAKRAFDATVTLTRELDHALDGLSAARQARAAAEAAKAATRTPDTIRAALQATQRFHQAERRLSNAQSAFSAASQLATQTDKLSRLKPAAEMAVTVAGASASLAQQGISAVKDADSNFFDSINDYMHWGDSPKDQRDKIAAMRRLLSEKKAVVDGMKQDLDRQEEHCAALAQVQAELEQFMAQPTTRANPLNMVDVDPSAGRSQAAREQGRRLADEWERQDDGRPRPGG